jgi:hypothetical protein
MPPRGSGAGAIYSARAAPGIDRQVGPTQARLEVNLGLDVLPSHADLWAASKDRSIGSPRA